MFDLERLLEREQYYLDVLRPEYNVALKAGSPMWGRTPSEEHRRKNSEAQKGKTLSEETKRKIGEASKGRLHSEEDLRKMSAAQKGKPRPSPSPETRAKLRKARKGRSPGAKLTEQDVREIKALLQDSRLPQREIAVRYGVGQGCVSTINIGHFWSHIGNENATYPLRRRGGIYLET